MTLTPEELSLIRSEYRQMLEIPEKPDPLAERYFVCPVGLVGAGKTTAIKPISEALGLVRISNDEARRMLKERGEGYDQLREVMIPLIQDLAKEGFNLSFDADCGNPETKKLIKDLAQNMQAKIFWIHINPPEEFILTKLKNYKHTWLFKDADQAIQNYFLQKQRRMEENTYFDFFAQIDTSASDPDDQIGTVISRIKKEIANV